MSWNYIILYNKILFYIYYKKGFTPNDSITFILSNIYWFEKITIHNESKKVNLWFKKLKYKSKSILLCM